MENLISLSLNLITKLLPTIPALSTGIVSDIVKTVAVATPVVLSTYKDLKPILSNIIKGIKNNGAGLTEEDWNALIEAEKLIDEEFERAAEAALAEDAAADKAP